MTRCTICKRELTDPASVARGWGPECDKIAQERTDLARQFPLGCRVRYRDGNSCEGLEGQVIGHRHRARKPSLLVIRVDGKTFLHTALPTWVARIEEARAA
jgi:hypothetical protein